MPNTIYLYEEHKYYQAGKSRLKKASVFRTHILWIILSLLIGLLATWAGGYGIRMAWQFQQSGAETRGMLLSCSTQQSSESAATFVGYEYTVDGKSYTAEDDVESFNYCRDFQYGAFAPVYYLASDPQISRLEAFVTGGEWLGTGIFAFVGVLSLLKCFHWILQNRQDRYRYALLQSEGIVLDAMVRNAGSVTGKTNSYYYANYSFDTPDVGTIYGQIRNGRGFSYPMDIKRHDILKILYCDKDTYCVL